MRNAVLIADSVTLGDVCNARASKGLKRGEAISAEVETALKMEENEPNSRYVPDERVGQVPLTFIGVRAGKSFPNSANTNLAGHAFPGHGTQGV